MTARRLGAILAAVWWAIRALSARTRAMRSRGWARCAEPSIKKHSGRLFKIMGDGFLVDVASTILGAAVPGYATRGRDRARAMSSAGAWRRHM
jgi:class 3 adenylate cyclase